MNNLHQADTSSRSIAGGRLTVDLGALADNWRVLAQRAGGAETGAAVKGNAYGIGLEPAVVALAAAGCRTFFVALPAEGLRLRAALPEATIYVLNGLAEGSAHTLADKDLRPVLGSLAEIEEWAAYRAGGGRGLAALHVDTGMNRLGLTLDQAGALAQLPESARSLGLSLVMSHLACADTPDHPLNARQLGHFGAVAALFPDVPASLAHSAGIHLGSDYHFNLVRPGIALYGGAFMRDEAPLRTVITVETRIIQVRVVPEGETVGYGATQTTRRTSRIGILSTGYADGYLRAASSSDLRPGASVFVHGKSAPLFGRVSMDLMAIDLTDIPDAARGDFVELFGPNIAIDTVAASAGTIGYEFMTSLGDRYERHYVGGA
ncbi:alanine racemase [Kaistia dalseonensis]|uniref:Alanine racemase n=1 Tax=Kaistia dalseonensis TaxID=410840 RepID=A0ABU0H2L3_9HYPH|nr:alanine racemase [Kaistia dalseonensis]MCX5493179.1 alanine racemase [Kaistia dalseonensis]MDQ0435734.1 alanine racemase [Kaistia dalseonensis]